MSGWIKLHKKVMEWEWYSDNVVRSVWFHLLLCANYEPKKYKGCDVPIGASVQGRKRIADDLGLSEKAVRRALEVLEKGQQVAIKRYPKFSIISIVKWSEYQIEGPAKGQQREGQRATPIEEYNNTIPNGMDIRDVKDLLWRDGLNSLKRQTGQPERTCRSLIGKWLKAANDDCAKVLTAINQSEADRVFDPVSWIGKAVQPKKLNPRQKWGAI